MAPGQANCSGLLSRFTQDRISHSYLIESAQYKSPAALLYTEKFAIKFASNF